MKLRKQFVQATYLLSILSSLFKPTIRPFLGGNSEQTSGTIVCEKGGTVAITFSSAASVIPEEEVTDFRTGRNISTLTIVSKDVNSLNNSLLKI